MYLSTPTHFAHADYRIVAITGEKACRQADAVSSPGRDPGLGVGLGVGLGFGLWECVGAWDLELGI